MTNITDPLAFITAGDATFTVTSAKTGTHFTYRVSEMPKGDGFFVSVLTGPDNTQDYSYAGLMIPSPSGTINAAPVYQFRGTRGSKLPLTAPSVRGFVWVLRRLQTCGLGEAATLAHIGRCGRCRRPLTTPESIERGLGPVCAGKAA